MTTILIPWRDVASLCTVAALFSASVFGAGMSCQRTANARDELPAPACCIDSTPSGYADCHEWAQMNVFHPTGQDFAPYCTEPGFCPAGLVPWMRAGGVDAILPSCIETDARVHDQMWPVDCCDSNGAPVAKTCSAAADCPQPSGECVDAVCEAGTCAVVSKPWGTALTNGGHCEGGVPVQ